IDRGIALATDYGFGNVDIGHWTATRDEIRHAVETDGVDAASGSFVQRFDSTAVDASLLQLAIVGFVEPDDPRMRATVRRIEAELCTDDGFVRRYPAGDTETVDGNAEGVFLLCTCWLVQVLAMQGNLPRARELLERVIAVANDVGLLAEEFDPTTGEMLGNFPQAFTHLGLIAAVGAVQAKE
ncbi:MAG: glycoside hydrolase family 15 protein, partial [Gemmatimonadaceae bacterium]